MSAPGGESLLTLEPLMEAVREGVETAGWELSGMQKTTSHQFEGRWDGESTRSAYLFFHSDAVPGPVSVDVYLDETSRGLTGNLALVVDLVDLGQLGDPAAVLKELGSLSTRALPPRYATPLTLRLRMKDGDDDPASAETEVRFKLRLSKAAIAAGPDAIRELSATAISAFESILEAPELARFIAEE